MRIYSFQLQLRQIHKPIYIVFNSFDVATWVKTHFTDSEAKKTATSQGNQPGLKIAGSSTNGAAQQDEGVGIMMAMDKDESTRRQERAAEAELKRQQNALPAWHLKSTITGDLTALGIEETRRAEAVAAAAAAAAALSGAGGSGSGNDEILRGLGIVGVPSRSAAGASASTEQVNGSVEDEKPKVGQDDADCAFFPYSVNISRSRTLSSVDYDQYYASLAASTTVSAVPTPTPARSSESGDYSYNLEEDEEEDRKPNVEYLDSLNDYRKRSRSKEDVDGSSGGNGSRKIVKTNSEMSVNGHLGINGYADGGGVNGNGSVVGGTPGDTAMDDVKANGSEYDTGAGVEEGGGMASWETEDDIVYGMYFCSPQVHDR